MARRDRDGDDDGGERPLTELARGFRKRTLVTTRLLAKVGVRMAKASLGGAARVAKEVDEDDAVAAARELLDQLDGLKGLTMKLGQMISYTDASLPPAAQRVLGRLQAASRPMAGDRIAEVVRAELGGAPGEVFDRFEPEPFAAASIGQVHRAELGDRAWAVKVQYPGIDELLRADIKNVGRLARLATLLSPVDGGALVDELAARVLEECDYAGEAANQVLFARLLAGDPDIDVPAVRADRSTRRVLTSELVERDGFQAFLDRAPQAARDRAGAAIYRVAFATIFGHGLYNTDPHPGNYLFAADGAVTLLDFGGVKRFSAGFIATWKRIARSILDDDRPGFRAAWIDAGFVGRARGFDFDHQYEAMRFLYRPALTPAPTAMTHAFVAEIHDRLTFANKNKLKLALPADWLFVNRLQFGLFSVLAHLGATVRFDRLLRDALDLPTKIA